MSENADKNWEELLRVFTCDIASALTPIEGYAGLLEEYLEKLAQQENIPAVSLSLNQDITPEMALKMIRVIREHSHQLRELKSAMSHEVGLNTGPILSYMQEREKLITRPEN